MTKFILHKTQIVELYYKCCLMCCPPSAITTTALQCVEFLTLLEISIVTLTMTKTATSRRCRVSSECTLYLRL